MLTATLDSFLLPALWERFSGTVGNLLMQPMLFHPQLRSVGQINKDIKLFLSRQWSLPCVDKHAKSLFIPQDLHVNSPFLTGIFMSMHGERIKQAGAELSQAQSKLGLRLANVVI